MKKVLFVCTGNTCRSVLAQYYSARLASDKKLDLAFSSAGLAADKDIPQPSVVAELLSKEGVREFRHVPAQLTGEMIGAADIVLVMTAAHKAAVSGKFPEAAAKTFTLVEYAGFGNGDIADPYGLADPFYFSIFRLIKAASGAALEKLKK